MYCDAMGVGYFLDPRFMCLEFNFMSPSLEEKIVEFLAENCALFFPGKMGVDVRLEIVNYRSHLKNSLYLREYYQRIIFILVDRRDQQ